MRKQCAYVLSEPVALTQFAVWLADVSWGNFEYQIVFCSASRANAKSEKRLYGTWTLVVRIFIFSRWRNALFNLTFCNEHNWRWSSAISLRANLFAGSRSLAIYCTASSGHLNDLCFHYRLRYCWSICVCICRGELNAWNKRIFIEFNWNEKLQWKQLMSTAQCWYVYIFLFFNLFIHFSLELSRSMDWRWRRRRRHRWLN